MPCDLKVIANIDDESRLEFFCTGDSDAFAASAVYHPEPSPDIEVWEPKDIISPASKKKTLSASDLSYAISATVEIFGSDKTTVTVIVRIKEPATEAKDHVVCTVTGTNGTVEYPRVLINMA